MKKRISSNIRWARFLFILFGFIFLTALIITLAKDSIHQDAVIAESIFLIICPILYYLFDKAKTVEFDKDFMYVTSKNKKEKIPLKMIYKIKLTMTEINNRSMWKISYYDENNISKSVRILPRWFYQDFYEFKDAVIAVNKNLIYKSYSHSFDIDQ
tara:strand:+ start:274 stop:741 length:468 start_codon:yes stop_codon:yes gene_type:complete